MRIFNIEKELVKARLMDFIFDDEYERIEDKEAFYDEVLKAMWGYISDKLNIPVSQLSKDNIEEELNKYGVSEDLIKAFISTLNECEFARYAPGNQNEAMDKVYSSAIDIISKMENCIKR